MTAERSLAEAVAGGPVVLDGGLATQLEAQGHDLSDRLWSARLLLDDPDEVVAAHAAFLGSGAQVVTTASYQATYEGFAAAGLGDAAVDGLLRRSVELARRAAADAAGERWVAASVGPYGAMLADGSEYRGRYGLDIASLRRFHRRRLRVLADAGPDVLALETVPCVAEGEALVAELAGLGVPAWLSYTVSGDQTRAGEPAAQAFSVAKGVDEVVAVGINCSDPADAATLVPVAAAAAGKPVVVYPNSGEEWDPVRRRWTGGRGFVAGAVESWLRDGAVLVGGCCRVGPAEVAGIAEAVHGRPGPPS